MKVHLPLFVLARPAQHRRLRIPISIGSLRRFVIAVGTSDAITLISRGLHHPKAPTVFGIKKEEHFFYISIFPKMISVLSHVAMGYPQAWGENRCGTLLAGETLNGMGAGGLQEDSAMALSWSNTSVPHQFELPIGNLITGGKGVFATATKGTFANSLQSCPQFSFFYPVSSEDVFLYTGTGESVDIDIAWAASRSDATVYYQRLSLPATASPPPLPPPRVPLGMPDSPPPPSPPPIPPFFPPFSPFSFGLLSSS